MPIGFNFPDPPDPNLRNRHAMNSAYVSTFLGNRFYLTRPHIDDIAIEDIAHGLAYQCRFNGQTSAFYSVAQHSLMVVSLVPESLQLQALLHDAAEAYLGDMVKPLKFLFPEFSVIEARVMEIIGQRFAIDLTRLDPAIKRADMIALATEKRDLMPYSTEPWSYLEGIDALPDRIEPTSPQAAKEVFLEAFHKLAA
jgi:5'-deoxynucleotidase YfbR-like HD superfamily hydrolase